MNYINYIDRIEKLGACSAALEWLRAENRATLSDAWVACERPDWMLWMAGRCSGKPGEASRRKLARCAAECAALVLPIYERWYPGDDSTRKAIEAAMRGDPDECRAASYAAYAASYAAYAAAYAAAAATAASAYDASAAADVRVQCLEIVRRYYPKPPRLPARAMC
jgi:hypothetical protein